MKNSLLALLAAISLPIVVNAESVQLVFKTTTGHDARKWPNNGWTNENSGWILRRRAENSFK